ncbi:XdhC family protein [Candidatus Sumerlaeota bacterium]|nr:XdhC family protein [Candidatus Sumerlaeota bacterium]
MANQNVEILRKAVELLEQGTSIAFATIIATKGSVPRREGTKMLITADGKSYGTIGGGRMEKEVVQLAQHSIREKKIQVKEFRFVESKPKSDEMICGGRLTIVIEPQQPAESLLICGGGHIGFALYEICRLLGFKIAIIDDRAEFATRERFPEAETVLHSAFGKAFSQITVTGNTYIVICTRRHQSDQTCLEQALKTDATYIGMLGSRAKWQQIKKNLRAKGFRQKDIQRVHCPIGLEIGAVTPEEIAISIAAELILHRSQRSEYK